MPESVYDWKNDDETADRNQTNDYSTNYDNPLNSFLYALKSSEAKRQYPARLIKFFDYLEIENLGVYIKDKSTLKYKLEKQSVISLEKAKIEKDGH